MNWLLYNIALMSSYENVGVSNVDLKEKMMQKKKIEMNREIKLDKINII